MKLKKTLSLILSICMIISLLPQIAFAGEGDPADDGIEIVYDFSFAPYGWYDTQAPDNIFTYEKSHNLWQYYAKSWSSMGVGRINYFNGTGMYLHVAWIAHKVNIPVSGIYTPYQVYGGKSNSENLDIYMIPAAVLGDAPLNAEISAQFVDDYKLGSVNCKLDGVSNQKLAGSPDVLAPKTLPAGEYYLVYNGGAYTIYGDLVLKSGDGKGGALTDTELDIGANEAMFKGQTVQAKLTGYLSNGEKKQIELSEATLSSNNTDVVEIDATGKITAKAAGSAKITASYKGFVEEKTITVAEGEASGVKVLYDFAALIGNWGDDTPFATSMTYDATYNLWKYHANSKNETSGLGSGKVIRNRDWGLDIHNQWFAVKIKIPRSGIYFMNQYYGERTGAGNLEVYFFPAEGELSNAEIEAKLIGENKVGDIECDVEGVTSEPRLTSAPALISAINPSAGEYYLVYKGNGNNVFANLILDGGDDAVELDLSLDIGKRPEILPGDSIQAKVSAYASDGEIKNLEASAVQYSSSDDDVATVDASGKITAVGPGEAEITATYNGLSDTKSLEVIEFVPANISIEYDFAAQFGGYSDDTPFATMTYETSGDTWAYYANSRNQTNGYGSGQAMRNRDWGIDFGGGWFALSVKVPKTGVYAPKQYYAVRGNTGGILSVYMFPKESALSNSEIAAYLTDEYKIGDVNCLGGDPSSYTLQAVPASFDSRRIEEGEYYVVYTAAGHTGFSNFMLDGIEGMKGIDVTVKQDIDVGESSSIFVEGKMLDGVRVPMQDMNIVYESSDVNVLSVIGNEIKGIAEGSALVTVTAKYGSDIVKRSVNVNVTDNSGVDYVSVKAPEYVFVRDSKTLGMRAYMKSGNVMDITGATFSIVSCDPEGAAYISEGKIFAEDAGTATVKAAGTFKGQNYEAVCEIELRPGATKEGRSLYTDEMVANAKENISKYSWAKAQAEEYIETADKYLNNFNAYYKLIYGEGIPRARLVVGMNNDERNVCRVCGKDVTFSGGWKTDSVNRPWKVQCSQCKRLFPSNEFEKLVKLGTDEKGYYSRARALEAHRAMLLEMGISLPDGEVSDARKEEIAKGELMTEEEKAYYGYGVKEGYLYNKLYSDIDTIETVNFGKGLYETEKVETWGVDDGWGYLTGKVDINGTPDNTADDIIDRHCHIAYFNYRTLSFDINPAIYNLGYAYLFTDDDKYARAGAMLLDRLADVYPSFSTYSFADRFQVVDGSTRKGKIVGYLDDCVYAQNLATAADMFFPFLLKNDAELIETLSSNATEMGLSNKKESGIEIWNNWEKNILLEIFREMKNANIGGNEGRYQACLATAALALDREPESDIMFEWLFKPGSLTGSGEGRHYTGGNILRKIVNSVDRDGFGTESGPHYNSMWFDNYSEVANLAVRYGKKEYDLYQNAKFLKMLLSFADITCVDSYTVQIGDSSSAAALVFNGSDDTVLSAFPYLKNTPAGPQFAEYLYERFGGDLSGLHYDIYTKDPEALEEDVKKYIEENPYTTGSKLLGGYGFAILRDGVDYENAGGLNSLRDFWIYFGGAATHKHGDGLNLGINAYGLNFSPELGYPTEPTANPERSHWSSATISHNTVMVDAKTQRASAAVMEPGDAMHFDDGEKVKLMDLSHPDVYDEVSEYRRTVVMVEINDDVSYGLDFFRVVGGNEHTFSFHTQTNKETGALSGLSELVPQVDENGKYVGSLVGMGPDGKGAPYTATVYNPDGSSYEETRYYVGPGADPLSIWSYGMTDKTAFRPGYTWLRNVRRAEQTEDKIVLDFDVTDYKKKLKDSKGLGMIVTTLNDFRFDEFAFAQGPLPNKSENRVMPKNFEYMIATRKGENLDSLFTTVYEPYKNENHIEKIELITPEIIHGSLGANDRVKAVKVTHKGNNRTDYIIYSTNESVTYRLENDDNMVFSGFVAVWSKNEGGTITYTYENAGKVTGKVERFTEDLVLDNYIDISVNEEVAPENLAGRYIIIENDGIGNAVYEILSAQDNKDGTVRLNTGTVTTVRSFIDATVPDRGYIYNIAKGQNFEIPMSYEQNFAPVFGDVSDGTTSAGSTYKAVVSATGYEGTGVTITGRNMPRGASFDSNSNTFSWKPDDSQVGENHVSLTATDELGRESVVHFTVTVYGNTTSKPSDKTETPGADGSSGTTDTPAGGGGGGAAPSDKPDDTTNTDGEEKEESGDNPENGNDVAPDASGETETLRFTDLGNHAWAENAINTLAEDGIIKGTTTSTFSPASNITRADFALLLVRAFKLSSDNTENFEDVTVNDYYASELAVARNTGIVNGIGDNRFAPRNTITRQDMMVIVYRALQSFNAELGVYDEPQYTDFDAVVSYAKEAVSSLIGAGIVNGKNNLIAPTDYTTRAEVAVLIKRILDYTNEVNG